MTTTTTTIRTPLQAMRALEQFEGQLQLARRTYEVCEVELERTRNAYERALQSGCNDCLPENACACDLLCADYGDAVRAFKDADRAYTQALDYERSLNNLVYPSWAGVVTADW